MKIQQVERLALLLILARVISSEVLLGEAPRSRRTNVSQPVSTLTTTEEPQQSQVSGLKAQILTSQNANVIQSSTLSPALEPLALTTTEQLEPEEDDYDYSEEKLDLMATNLTLAGRLTTTSLPAIPGQFPFVVFITSAVSTGTLPRFCTGTLLTPEYVLTAASCVYDATLITLRVASVIPLGALAAVPADGIVLAPPSTTVKVHPKYFKYPKDYDIALVKTAPAILGSNVAIAPLADKDDSSDAKDLAGKTLLVLGYGFPNSVSLLVTDVALRYAKMQALSSSKCSKEMRNRNVPRAGSYQSCLDTDSGSVGLCSGHDIGGPVLYKSEKQTSYKVVGVTSYYQGCMSGTPNVFTRLGPSMDFLRKYVSTRR